MLDSMSRVTIGLILGIILGLTFASVYFTYQLCRIDEVVIVNTGGKIDRISNENWKFFSEFTNVGVNQTVSFPNDEKLKYTDMSLKITQNGTVQILRITFSPFASGIKTFIYDGKEIKPQ